MKQILYFTLFATFSFATFQLILGVGDDFCMGKKHYTGQGFTCCNFKRFDAPKTNPFYNVDELQSCLQGLDPNEKLVRRAWLIYKCMVQKEVQDLSINSFADYMLKRFSSDPSLSAEIKKNIDAIKVKLPNKSRRKRSSRIKRDDEATPDEATPNDAGSTTMVTEPPAMEATEEMDSTLQNEGSTASGNLDESTEGSSTTVEEIPPDGSSTEESEASDNPVPENPATDAPVIPESEATEEPTTEASVEPKTNPASKPTQPPLDLSVYGYLSVFEYIDRFKQYIPDEELLRSWDVYYVAEFEACHRLAGDDDKKIKEFGSERCLSWIQRTARDGECCVEAPIPIPLYSYPLLDIEEIQNNTAMNILSLAGKYIWTNLTYSSNIDRCYRLSIAVLQGQVQTDDLKKEIENFVKGQDTKPNYEAIAEKLIPSYFEQSMRQKISETIQKENLDTDSDIEKIRNYAYPIYHWAVASEWDNPHENKTRYLMWTCDVYRMISQRIKYFDVTPYCY